jgi:hypothetical protein
MSLKNASKKRILLLGRIVCLGLLALAALLSRGAAGYLDPYGLFFVVVGGAAGALMTFSGGEIRTAIWHARGGLGSADELRRSALFWESTARNFWMLGVSRSILGFVISLGSLSGGISALTSGLADSLLAALYGMVLTVICYVPYWKLEAQRHYLPDVSAAPAPGIQTEIGGWQFRHILGYALFAAVFVTTLLKPPATEIWAILGWIVYWPSLLVVFGGTLALLLFLGDVVREPKISPGFAVTGLIGSLIGFLQVLLGISAGSIAEISSALTFILSSCFAALMGMFLLAAPLEDRTAKMRGESVRTSLSRVAWYVFPLMALIFLVAVFVLIVTPFERHK